MLPFVGAGELLCDGNPRACFFLFGFWFRKIYVFVVLDMYMFPLNLLLLCSKFMRLEIFLLWSVQLGTSIEEGGRNLYVASCLLSSEGWKKVCLE